MTKPIFKLDATETFTRIYIEIMYELDIAWDPIPAKTEAFTKWLTDQNINFVSINESGDGHAYWTSDSEEHLTMFALKWL